MSKNFEDVLNIININNFSGVLSLKEKDKILLEVSMGSRDRVNGLRNNINTKFGIASGTKFFTAIAIMLLAEEGKLNLKDPAFKYIPGQYNTYDSSITIEHLLSHTSGLPDYLDEDLKENPIDVPMYELLRPSDYLKIMPTRPMKFKPGEKFNYNNSGYIFLSVIIEEISGNYHEFITDNILKKAHMKDSGFFRMDDLPENTALGYLSKTKSNRTNIFSLPIIGSGDGGMFTTVNDIHKFWEAIENGRILEKASFKKMMQPYIKSDDLYYGLGLWLKKYNDKFIPLMIGQDAGVSFESGIDLYHDIKYVIISNTQFDVWPISKKLKEEIEKLFD